MPERSERQTAQGSFIAQALGRGAQATVDVRLEPSAEVLRQVIADLALAPALPPFHDLFEVVENPAEVRAVVFRTSRAGGLAPFVMPYIPARLDIADIPNRLYQILLESGGALLLQGRAGLGKTREVAELAALLCDEGWQICVAKGESDTRLHQLAAWPDALHGRKILFVFDDLHRRVMSGPGLPESYPERLELFLGYLQATLAPGEGYVIATTRTEPHHERQLQVDFATAPWNRFVTYELPEYTEDGLAAMLRGFAKSASVELDDDIVDDLIANCDRTPRTIYLNVERAVRRREPLTGLSWLPTQGESWAARFRQARHRWPAVDRVYQALHLVHEASLPTRMTYVSELAARLGGASPAEAAEGLVSMGLLGRREDSLDAFGTEQLEDSLLAVGDELPDLHDHWQSLTEALLAVATGSDGARELLALAEQLLDAGQEAHAGAAASRAIDLGEEDARVYGVRGTALFQQADYVGARADLTEAMRRNPAEVRYRGLLGMTHLVAEDFEAAEAGFSEAIAAGPTGLLHYWRGISRASRDLGAAEQDFAMAAELGHEPEASYYRLGRTQMEQKKYTEADAAFTRAIEWGRDDGEVYYRRGLVRFLASEFDSARQDFDATIERGTDEAIIYALRGQTRQQLNDHPGSMDDFNAAIARDPATPLYYYFRGLAGEHLGLHDEAEVDFGRAIDRGQDDDDVYFKRGRARYFKGDLAGAESDFGEAITRHCSDPWVYAFRGFTRLQLGKTALAHEDSDAAIRGGVDHAEVYHLRGGTSESDVEAEADFTEAIARGKQEVEVYQNRARVRIRLGRLRDARADCEEAERRAPDNATTLGRWGDLHLALGEFNNAIRRYQAATAAEPQGGWEPVLGVALLLGDQAESAEAMLAKCLEGETDSEGVRSVLDEIDFWLSRHPWRAKSPAVQAVLQRLRAGRQ